MPPESQERHLPAIAPSPSDLKKKSPVLKKNRKSSTACLSCKQAKRKCSGRPPPCIACRNAGVNCIFDETLDLRRKVAAKRTFEEKEHYRSLFHELVESLRTSDEEKVQYIINTIRKGGDMNDIAAVIESPTIDSSDTSSECPKGIGNADDPFMQQGYHSVDTNTRITVDKLCDYPLFNVPSRPWTAVTEDNHLVSHLVSLYFVWDHPLLQVVDRELFLSGMNTKGASSEFCTPVLVNSILAVASTYSDSPEVLAVPDDMTSRGQHFLMEAERLWRAEDGLPSLTNIQALTLMSHAFKLQGNDNISWLVLRQAVQLGQDFGMFKIPRTSYRQWNQMSGAMKRASTNTAWAIFILNSQISMEFGKLANLSLPRSSLDPRDLFGQNDAVWTPYPLPNCVNSAKKHALLHSVMTMTASLTEIVVEIQDLLFDKSFDFDINDAWNEATRLYSRLSNFLQRLRDLQNTDDERLIPQMLFLYIRYDHVNISLSRFLLEHQDLNQLPSSLTKARGVRMTQIDSAKRIAQYLRMHREHFGLQQIPGLMFGPISNSALTLLGAFNEDDQAVGAFNESCRFLVSLGKKLPAANEMICRIGSIARDSQIMLPIEIAREISTVADLKS